MEKKLDYRSGLRTASILYLIMAVLEVAVSVLAYFDGNYDASALSAASGLSVGTVNAIIYGLLGLSALTVLVRVWLGVAGIRQVNGKPVGKAHIVVGTIVAVFTTIAFLLDLMGVNSGTVSVSDAALSAASLSMILMYLTYAKKTLQAE